MTLLAGAAGVDITPPVGSLMAAFPRGPQRTPRRATGILDPLMARALVLSGGQEMVAIAHVDLCGIRHVSVQRIRRTINSRVHALQPEKILLAASHTHSGAETSFLFGGTPDDPIVRQIEDRIAEGVIAAHAARCPVHVAWGRTTLALNHNRRVLDRNGKTVMAMEYEAGRTLGPVDEDLDVVRFDATTGKPVAVLYHYTAHALTLGPANDQFSADFPGKASRLIEESLPGAQALFLNGAAGNVHPRECMRGDTQALNRIGTAVGEAALDTARHAARIDDDTLAFASDRLVFPNRSNPQLEVPVEVAVFRLGPLLFGFVPGEFFVEHQLAFKKGAAPLAGILVGYANGWPGYAPTLQAYDEGGYGVDLAIADQPEYCRTSLPPGAGETVIARLRALLTKVL